ncbi:MAG: N-acetyl sugar amidotransferase [Lachnospiraceae bacterium]|jgi:N-acetyl sugar amidotransferase|nr:N-acetyl sugar amidotransferase [Lachnospiraceae bacterium]MCI9132981.1 N-acetyl sugar amidotransferase [Lachnospiraceae bacterium]
MLNNSDNRICTRCIMDMSDPNITFDEKGVCNHCHQYDRDVALLGYKGKETELELKKLIKEMKAFGKGREYDCILGISGGVDSAYMAYLVKKWGLRVLAVHVDAGWNSEIAVENIQKMCKALGMDLHTIVIDWPSMREIQRAYMFSGLPNLDVPQDHVFMAAMYAYAKKYKIKYMLNGSNLSTEGILPNAWGYTATDFRSIKSVYKKWGRRPGVFKKYPHFGILKYFYYQMTVKRIKILNYVPYSKKEAMKVLEREFDWKYYGGKHFESRFTKFFQAYYLPEKFHYDKKRAHLSSLIVGGEMTREEALKEMEDASAYPREEMLEDRDYILKKLDISLDQWEKIMKGPCKSEDDYASSKRLINLLVKGKRLLQIRRQKG